jgi:hypothetical protein
MYQINHENEKWCGWSTVVRIGAYSKREKSGISIVEPKISKKCITTGTDRLTTQRHNFENKPIIHEYL